MDYSKNRILERVYSAQTDDQRRAAYDAWASDYDRDVLSFGIRLPFVAAAVFAKNVDTTAKPILDAACGTGMHTEPLRLAGYNGFIGVDISDAMLALAAQKNIYDQLLRMPLDRLDYDDNHFAHAYCIGALAPGHASAESLDELQRVTAPGGLVIFSTHAHENERTEIYHHRRRELEENGLWRLTDETEPFVSMPGGDEAIKHAIYVYRIT